MGCSLKAPLWAISVGDGSNQSRQANGRMEENRKVVATMWEEEEEREEEDKEEKESSNGGVEREA